MKFRNLFFAAVAALALIPPAAAQGYEARWKKAENLVAKDLPKSALSEVREIYRLAGRDGNTGEMLKAALSAVGLQGELSGDSAVAEAAKIDSIARAKKRPLERALWLVAAAAIYSGHGADIDGAADTAVARAVEGTKDLAVFKGHKAKEFLPVITKGAESKYFDGDLAHTVCRRAIEILSGRGMAKDKEEAAVAQRRDLEHRYISLYAPSSDAYLLAKLDSMRTESEASDYSLEPADTLDPQIAMPLQLARSHASSPCAVEAYIYVCTRLRNGSSDNAPYIYKLAREGAKLYPRNPRTVILRNLMRDLKQKGIWVEGGKLLYPGQEAKASARVENITQTDICLYRLPLSAYDFEKAPADDIRKMKLRDKQAVYTVSHATDSDVFKYNLSFKFKAPSKPGVYYAATSADDRLGRWWEKERNIVYVSNLRLISLPLPGARMRFTVVDARSGKPVAGAKVCEYSGNGRENIKLAASYSTDAEGKAVLPYKNSNNTYYSAEFGDDKYMPLVNVWHRWPGESRERKATENYRLYADRGIYRPGQTVHLAGIVFSQQGDNLTTLYDKKIKLRAIAANNKEIAQAEVSSDEFGSFGASFTLPAEILPGTVRISANGKETISLRVEEYKRPTFEVEVGKPAGKYSEGDTVNVAGNARAYTGVGMQYAMVAYDVERSGYIPRHGYSREVIFRDTVATDTAGNFFLRVPLTADSRNRSHSGMTYTVNVSVTSGAGETQTSGVNIFTSKQQLNFSSDIGKTIDRDRAKPVTFILRNNSGENVAAKGRYIIYKDSTAKCAEDTFSTNVPQKIAALASLPSGRYTMHTQIDGEADSIYDLKKTFVLLSMADTRPADSAEHIRLYSPARKFGKDGKAKVQLGTSLKGATLFYDITANDKLVESRVIELSDSLVCLDYDYKPEYGDGLFITVALVRDGELYSENMTMAKPVPDKRLRYKWTSFRDRLRPSQKEEWRLNVFEPDGSPAKASAVVSIYDASLDKFAANRWNSQVSLPRHIKWVEWSMYDERLSFSYVQDVKSEKVVGFELDRIFELAPLRPRNKESRAMDRDVIGLAETITSSTRMYKSNMSLAAKGVAAQASVAEVALADAGGDAGTAQDAPVRGNFAETAYFAPSLRSDESGRLELVFTAPESMTRWNVKLLAHTQAMNMVEADTTATVVKEFMVRPNLPRFVRVGDAATIPATIVSLSDRPLAGKAVMTIRRAENLAVVRRETLSFKVGAKGETTVVFPYSAAEAADAPLVVVDIAADCGSSSDGERHYLPLLPSKVEVLASQPFTLKAPGRHSVDVSKLFPTGKAADRRLTVEYTSNPLWLAIQALPTIQSPKYEDVLALAAAYYASALERSIASAPEIQRVASRWASEQTPDTLLENTLERNQDLKNTVLAETPWAGYADKVSLRRRNLARAYSEPQASMRERNLLERLRRLQAADGGFGWMPGMPSSEGITAGVARMLLRLGKVAAADGAQAVVGKAVGFLSGRVAGRIKSMRKDKAEYFSMADLTYLDILRLYGGKLPDGAAANRRYLLGLLQKEYPALDMKAKATAALVLNVGGHKKEASIAMRSIAEHLVTDKDKGAFFDSFRAPSFGESYKIPTQVAALEAVRELMPADKALQEDMLTWIMQAKRTQGWNTTLATVDAVYALLACAGGDSAFVHLSTAQPGDISLKLRGGKNIDVAAAAKTADADATGYMRADFRLDTIAAAPVALNVEKADGGISWGAVYGRSLADAATVRRDGKEFAVSRDYVLVSGGKETRIGAGTSLGVGDLVRVRYTIIASRDYDYVSLSDPRPACLEPVATRSGYSYRNGQWCYLAVRDASQSFFFEHLAKGRHTVTCDFRVDRNGKYTAAPATVQCLYAPEFAAHSDGFTIKAGK